jgi:hypothetical protein
MIEIHEWMRLNPDRRDDCAALRAQVANEQGCDRAEGCPRGTPCFPSTAGVRSHCIRSEPTPVSPTDTHVLGRAFDVSDNTIIPLQTALGARNPPRTVQRWLDAPTNCGLIWGAPFSPPDPWHFQLR